MKDQNPGCCPAHKKSVGPANPTALDHTFAREFRTHLGNPCVFCGARDGTVSPGTCPGHKKFEAALPEAPPPAQTESTQQEMDAS